MLKHRGMSPTLKKMSRAMKASWIKMLKIVDLSAVDRQVSGNYYVAAIVEQISFSFALLVCYVWRPYGILVRRKE